MRVRGSFLRDNRVVVRDVTIDLVEPNFAVGRRTWTGTAQLTRGQYLDVTNRYVLELADGRSADILVTRFSPGGTFRDGEPLPEPFAEIEFSEWRE